jgi:hypothetical protein
MIDYSLFPGLQGVYLADSYVLAVDGDAIPVEGDWGRSPYLRCGFTAISHQVSPR